MGKINVAIIGVGNCSSSLVQGVHYYREAKENEFVPGLMHVNLGGYHISDINFVAAFDIDKNKVGKDLSEAVFAIPGVGRLIVDSILRRDYPVIQGVMLMVTVGFLAINLMVDMLYGFLDPKIRY